MHLVICAHAAQFEISVVFFLEKCYKIINKLVTISYTVSEILGFSYSFETKFLEIFF